MLRFVLGFVFGAVAMGGGILLAAELSRQAQTARQERAGAAGERPDLAAVG